MASTARISLMHVYFQRRHHAFMPPLCVVLWSLSSSRNRQRVFPFPKDFVYFIKYFKILDMFLLSRLTSNREGDNHEAKRRARQQQS